MESVLVLNFSYEVLNITNLKRAVRLVFAGKAEVLHDSGSISSVSKSFKMPSVIRMLYYVARGRRRLQLTKKNVLLRDDYKCAYCSHKCDHATATVDHVVPRSMGGKSTWENLVTSCSECNSRKRDRTPREAGMPLRIKAREPSYIPFLVVRRNTTRNEWGKYLSLYSIGIEDRPG